MMHQLKRAAAVAWVVMLFAAVPAHAQSTATAAPVDSAKIALIHQLLRETKAVDQSIAVMDASIAA